MCCTPLIDLTQSSLDAPMSHLASVLYYIEVRTLYHFITYCTIVCPTKLLSTIYILDDIITLASLLSHYHCRNGFQTGSVAADDGAINGSYYATLLHPAHSMSPGGTSLARSSSFGSGTFLTSASSQHGSESIMGGAEKYSTKRAATNNASEERGNCSSCSWSQFLVIVELLCRGQPGMAILLAKKAQ